ncbi:paired-like homeodomain transcription factor LEUTX [Acomys russatus]|uniref:paired-like homeodomain transcription factor LEUTX n=1 Tax=Acomys russatus TaxID=60746 RepID=UPI0021E336D1|nr:paired-like homeodomain transcription factor LEUTX [Acomys russatus]
MSGKPQHSRRFRTALSDEQIRALQDAFHRNMFPDQWEIQELASRLQINHRTLQMWFKNQQDVVMQQRNYQRNSSLAASNQAMLMRGGASSNQAMLMRGGASSNQAMLMRGGASSNQAMLMRGASSNQVMPVMGQSSSQPMFMRDQESQKNSGEKQQEAGASAMESLQPSQGFDIDQIDLGPSPPPWASMTQDIDEFVKMYDLPGDVDPKSFDKYLPPGCFD